MNTNISIYHKNLITIKRSKRNIQNLKTLGITRPKHSAQNDRKQERYKNVGERMRERYKKSRGFNKGRRKKRRRR